MSLEVRSERPQLANGRIRPKSVARSAGRLVEKGLMPKSAAEILHGLRFMGNAAAHELKARSIKNIETALVETALDVVEILLQHGAVDHSFLAGLDSGHFCGTMRRFCVE